MTEATCEICGKPLSDDESIERGIGPVCLANMNNQAAIDRMEMATVETVPEDYVPLKEALDLCSQLGIPHGRLVKAMGGDKLAEQPAGEEFFPAYVGGGRRRYLPKAALSKIPDLLAEGNDKPKPVPVPEPVAEPTVEPEPEPKPRSNTYEVVAPNYGMEIGTLTTVPELKAAFSAEHGVPIQLRRHRTKGGYVEYRDVNNGLAVLAKVQ